MGQSTEEAPRFALIDAEFDPTRAPASIKAAKICRTVIEEVLEYEQAHALRTRKRKSIDQDIFERIITALVCNLLHQHFTALQMVACIEGLESKARKAFHERSQQGTPVSDREKAKRLKESEHHTQVRQDWKEQGVHITLSNRHLGAGLGRYRHPVMSQALPGTVKLMRKMGFLTVSLHGHKAVEGFNFPARQTCIKAGPKLLDLALTALSPRSIDIAKASASQLSHFRHEHILPEGKLEETIILKSRKLKGVSKPLEYAETDQTRRCREEMAAINAFLAEADLEAVDHNGQALLHIDTRQRYLRRHFNHGRFDCGGRLFGGFWMNMPKAERHACLRIQGEPVLTLDYGQMAPRILYAMKVDKDSIPPVYRDCYSIQGLEAHRQGIKKLLNVALNREGIISRFPPGVKELFPKGAKVTEIMAAIKEAHPALAGFLCTDEAIGLEIQFQESSIMVEVLLRLYTGTEGQSPVTALPVHDAVIIPESAEQVAKETMRSVFMERMGIDILMACSSEGNGGEDEGDAGEFDPDGE